MADSKPPLEEQNNDAFRALVEQSVDGMLVVDGDGIVRYANSAAVAMTPGGDAGLIGSHVGIPVGSDRLDMTVVREGATWTAEMRASEIQWEGQPAHLISLRDVTEQRRDRLRVEYLNRVLRAIRDVNKLIVQERNAAELLRQACDILVEERSFEVAWIVLDPRADSGPLAFHAGVPDADAQGLLVALSDGRLPECCRRARDEGGVAVTHEPDSCCHACSITRVRSEGAAIVVCMQYQGQVHGYLNVFMPETFSDDNAETTSLVEEIAGDLAFALHGIEQEQARRQAEERVRQERDFAERLIDTARAIVLVLDPDGRIVRFNAFMQELTGYTLDEVRGRDWFQTFIPERHRTSTRELFKKAASGTPTRGNVNPVLTRGGKERQVEWYDSILGGKNGQIAGLLIIGHDITERLAANRDRDEANTRLAAAVNAGQVGLWDFYPQEGRAVFSDEWKAQLGYAPDEIDDNADEWSSRLHPDDRERAAAHLTAYLEGGGQGEYSQEFRLSHKDGTYRWMLSQGAAVAWDGEGRVTRMLGCHVDITERKRSEEEIRRFEWLLDRETSPPTPTVPTYGDVTELNTERTILDSVGMATLQDLAADAVALLDTSFAVYERNGDYAFGMFVSKWCGMLNNAGRQLCGTPDNREALRCGKWLCHENCWNESARAAIESGEPTDIGCVGGVRLYAVPVKVGNDVIGVVNIGYGNPPTDDETLTEIASAFGIDAERVREAAREYKPRPPFIVEVAKRRVNSIARTIGEIVERRQASMAMQRSEELLNETGDMARVGGWELDLGTDTVMLTRTTEDIHEIPHGYKLSLEEAVGFYAEARDEVSEAVRRAREEGIPYDLEVAFRTAKGRDLWVHAIGKPEFQNGKCVRLHGTFQDITERKKAENALRETRAHLELVLETIPDLVWLKDVNGVYQLCNTRFEAFFGAPEEAIVGKTDHDFVPKELADSFRANDRKAMARNQPTRNEERITFASDGHQEVLETIKTSLRDKSGNVIGVLGIGRDITERMQAEEDLRISEERYRRVTENSPAVVYQFRMAPDGTPSFPFITESVQTVIGISSHDLMRDAHTLLGLIVPEQQKAFQESVLESFQKLSPYQQEIKLSANGKTIWILARSVPEPQPDGSVLWDGFFEDITQRKMAETALRAAERRNRALLDYSPACHKIVDLDFNLQYMSKSGFGMYGLDENYEACGKPYPFEFLREAFRQEMMDELERVKATGKTRALERAGNNVNGQELWLYSVLVPVPDDSGELDYITVVTGDFTAQRHLEEELRQSQKLDAVGQLAGGVAHDFNNLLQGVLGYGSLSLDALEDDHPAKEYIEEILEGARRSADLTRQLLGFARKQTIVPEVLDLNETVANMLKLLRRLIGEDINLVWQPGPNLWSVKMDPGQVDQVLANLCVNARDAIGGVGKITIETHNAELDADYCANHTDAIPGNYVVLGVSDTGRGMDRETLARVFEPFFTTKGPGKGTGLGLATVHGIVKQNEGNTNVYSEPGKGTTFRIYLPRFADEDAAETDKGDTTETAPHGSETILLVEDDKSIRVTVGKSLAELGYNVLSAEEPNEAQRLVNEHASRIHLLITDVVMPGMNGRDLSEQLTADMPELKTLYISGYTANVIAHHGILEEGVEFLSKPFTSGVLARKVRELLDR